MSSETSTTRPLDASTAQGEDEGDPPPTVEPGASTTGDTWGGPGEAIASAIARDRSGNRSEDHTTADGTVYATADAPRPVPTDAWWSTAATRRFGGPLHWGPAVGRPTDAGFAVASRPGAAVPVQDDGGPQGTDFTIGGADGTYAYACVADWGDWHVDLRWGAGTTTPLDVTLVRGSPFAFAACDGDEIRLAFDEEPIVWADRGEVLGVSVDGAHYGLFAPEGTTWDGVGGATLANDLRGECEAGTLAVAVLPDFAQSTLDAFERYAYNRITDTELRTMVDPATGRTTTTFSVTTTGAGEEAPPGTLVTVDPGRGGRIVGSVTPHEYELDGATVPTVAGSSFRVVRAIPAREQDATGVI